jgi:hypothetical protein
LNPKVRALPYEFEIVYGHATRFNARGYKDRRIFLGQQLLEFFGGRGFQAGEGKEVGGAAPFPHFTRAPRTENAHLATPVSVPQADDPGEEAMHHERLTFRTTYHGRAHGKLAK